jgi:hypothetical protein
MNIEDVKAPAERPADLMEAIFSRQMELVLKYHPIEDRNGLLHTPLIPVNLHDRFGQAQLKDLAWRMTEEFTEATDAGEDYVHYLEEIIDAFHFFVELCILAGYRPTDSLEKMHLDSSQNWVGQPYKVIERVGCAMNCLKNKPWKQTHMLTDIEKFNRLLGEAWVEFILIFVGNSLTSDDVYDLYFRKSEVNKFRQRSKY